MINLHVLIGMFTLNWLFLQLITFNNNKHLIRIVCFVHQMLPIGCLLLLLWITAISIISPLTTLISWMNTTHGKILELILGEWMFHDIHVGSPNLLDIINKWKIIRKITSDWKMLVNILENSVWYYTFLLKK